MSIFVTGGTGFLGKHLVKELSYSSEDIHLLVRENGNLRGLDNKRFKIFPGDVTNVHTVKNAIKGYLVSLATEASCGIMYLSLTWQKAIYWHWKEAKLDKSIFLVEKMLQWRSSLNYWKN